MSHPLELDAAEEAATIAEAFDGVRPHLLALAYRMTGAFGDAEDLVQEAYLRWREVASDVVHPRAFLSKMVTRMCIDHMRSARIRRERYVGMWLPEPIVGDQTFSASAGTDLEHDISVALMLALERLSPLERAAFLLHDVFDVDYRQIARDLGRSEAACRKLAERARTQVRASRPKRPAPPPEEAERLVQAFLSAVASGDVQGLSAILSEDAVLHSDGGGRVKAAIRPIRGADDVARFFVGVVRKFPPPDDVAYRYVTINGLPGLVVEARAGAIQTLAFEIADGRIATLYAVRNPDKLARIR